MDCNLAGWVSSKIILLGLLRPINICTHEHGPRYKANQDTQVRQKDLTVLAT